MPKTKLIELMRGADWSSFQKEIRKQMLDAGLNMETVSKKMGVSYASLRTWIKNPSQFRLSNFVNLLESLAVSKEDKDWLIEEAVRQIINERRAG